MRLLPLYLTVGLGASALVVGVIEGVAEATALVVKIFSGALSDACATASGSPRQATAWRALTKPLLRARHRPALVFAARFVDRIGKGIRGAPRDALIADLTPPRVRGAAFGLRQSLDTVGAFTGPLLAMALMLAWNDDFRAVFWVAVVAGDALVRAHRVRGAASRPACPSNAGDAAPRIELRKRARAWDRAFWGVTAARRPCSRSRASARPSSSCAPGPGPRGRARAAGAGRHERRVSRWSPIPPESSPTAWRRARCSPRASPRSWPPTWCSRCAGGHRDARARRGAVGPAHGPHAGPARGDGRATAPGRAARHRFRSLQPRCGSGDARRERRSQARCGNAWDRRRRSGAGAVLALAALGARPLARR